MAPQETFPTTEEKTAADVTRENKEYRKNRARRSPFEEFEEVAKKERRNPMYPYYHHSYVRKLEYDVEKIYKEDQAEAASLHKKLKKLEEDWMKASSRYLSFSTTFPEKKTEKEDLYQQLTEARTALENFEKGLSGPKLRTEPINQDN